MPELFDDAFAEAWNEPQKSALSQAELDKLTDDLIEALKTVFDPEIPVDIYELGLIYRVDVSDDRDVVVGICTDGDLRRHIVDNSRNVATLNMVEESTVAMQPSITAVVAYHL